MLDWHFQQASPERKECDMNRDIVEGKWKQFKGKVRARWGDLTGDRHGALAGQRVRVQVPGRIQESGGITKDEAG